MPQYEVIRDIGSSLLALCEAELKKQKVKGKVVLAPPTREVFDKHAPALCLYLYEVRENAPYKDTMPWDKKVPGPDGKLVKVKIPAPLELELRWVLAAGAEDAAQEHLLLALGMKALHERPLLTRKDLKADHFAATEELPLRIDYGFDLGRAATLFRALEAPLKAAAGYVVPCRIFTDFTIQPAKRVEERDIVVYDTLHPPPGKPSGGGPLSPVQRQEREFLDEAAGKKKVEAK